MALQPDNGIPCLPFKGQPDDEVLLKVILPLLIQLCEYDGDVRPLLANTIRLRAWMESKGAFVAAAPLQGGGASA